MDSQITINGVALQVLSDLSIEAKKSLGETPSEHVREVRYKAAWGNLDQVLDGFVGSQFVDGRLTPVFHVHPDYPELLCYSCSAEACITDDDGSSSGLVIALYRRPRLNRSA